MDKKGSELSMNVIIIAAIAVLVLVILAMFIFRSGRNIEASTGCKAMNGDCFGGPGTAYTVRYPPGDAECGATSCWIAVGTNTRR